VEAFAPASIREEVELPYAWLCESPRLLRAPLRPMRGSLGLWRLDAALVAGAALRAPQPVRPRLQGRALGPRCGAVAPGPGAIMHVLLSLEPAAGDACGYAPAGLCLERRPACRGPWLQRMCLHMHMPSTAWHRSARPMLPVALRGLGRSGSLVERQGDPCLADRAACMGGLLMSCTTRAPRVLRGLGAACDAASGARVVMGAGAPRLAQAGERLQEGVWLSCHALSRAPMSGGAWQPARGIAVRICCVRGT
jgi:hypothetical protein